MATYPKEKLTLQDIHRDLRQEQKSVWQELLWWLFPMLLMALSGYLALRAFDAAVLIQSAFLVVVCGIGLLIVIRELVRLYRGGGELCIVQDKLVGMHETYSLRAGRYTGYMRRPLLRQNTPVTVYHLNFASYGEYTVPRENYSWSKQYSFSAHGVYLYSECGDTYYLVLSRRHTGKILLVYNTKLFELDQTQN